MMEFTHSNGLFVYDLELDNLIPNTFCARKFECKNAELWNFNKIELPDQKEDEIHYRHLDALYCYKRLLFKGQKSKFFGLHRNDDLPAYITKKQIHWFQNNECHRTDGPSSLILLKGGLRIEYCQNGNWHREGGPAIINQSGYNSYYENHKFIKKEKV